jgi:LEA14-like dessication related protein
MRKWVFYISTAAVLIGLIFMYRLLSQAVLEPKFIDLRDIEIGEVIDQKVTVHANAYFYNPNTFSAQILNTELKAYSNDVMVASISQTELTEVGANKHFVVPIKFDVDLLKLGLSQSLSGLVNQILSEEKTIHIKFTGYCRIKSKSSVFKIPIEYEDEFHIK